MTMMMVQAQGFTWDAFNSDHLAELITEKTGVQPVMAERLVAAMITEGWPVAFTTAETSQLTSVDGRSVPGEMVTTAISWSIERAVNGRHPRYWLHRQPQEA